MIPPPRRRRALSHVGGAIDTEGAAADAKLLAQALDVSVSTDDDDDPSRAHIHGFHTYPARMHPVTAARLVRAYTLSGGRVLDPFCGSGTVLVEAMVAGRAAFGTDLNPLAVLLSTRKTRPRSQRELELLVDRARLCATHADERRRQRAGASRRFSPEDIRLFEPHVLMELDSLRAGIESMGDDPAKPDLQLVLSALLVKLSKQRGDTSAQTTNRRTAPGFAIRQFIQKTEDLARRLAEFAARLPSPSPPQAIVQLDDAAELRTLPPEKLDAIVTSPPYAATYDYVAHHAARLRWLGLDATPLAKGEMGARCRYERIKPIAAIETWSRELARFFTAARRVLVKDAPLVLLMADSAVGDVALRAEEIAADISRDCGFIPVARASQPRPHFHGPTLAAFRKRPRAEHAILLRKA